MDSKERIKKIKYKTTKDINIFIEMFQNMIEELERLDTSIVKPS